MWYAQCFLDRALTRVAAQWTAPLWQGHQVVLSITISVIRAVLSGYSLNPCWYTVDCSFMTGSKCDMRSAFWTEPWPVLLHSGLLLCDRVTRWFSASLSLWSARCFLGIALVRAGGQWTAPLWQGHQVVLSITISVIRAVLSGYILSPCWCTVDCSFMTRSPGGSQHYYLCDPRGAFWI